MDNNTKTQYYIFSDEGGTYKAGHYFLRACFIISSEDYFNFSRRFIELKEKYNIPLNNELKFLCIFNLWRYSQKKNKKIDARCKHYKEYNLDKLKEFITKSVELLITYNIKIIMVYTKFVIKIVGKVSKDFMLTMLLRIESYLNNINGQGVIFYDDFNKSEKERYYYAYSKIFNEAKFVKKYTNIKDSLSFDSSKYSAGIQVVDYIIGFTVAFMNNYYWGKDEFNKLIYPNIYNYGNEYLSQSGLIPLYLHGDYSKYIINLKSYNYKPPKRLEDFGF